MGKISTAAQAQRERDKGNLDRARKLEQAMAEKDARLNAEREFPGITEQGMVAPGAQVRLPVEPSEEITTPNLPDDSVEMEMATSLTEDRRLPTESDRMFQEMREEESVAPYLRRVAEVPNYDIEGNLLPQTEESAELRMKENLASGLETTPRDIDYDFTYGLELANQVVGGTEGLSPYNVVADTGLRLQTSLNAELKTPSIDDRVGQEFIQLGIQAGMVDPDTRQFTRRAGNVIAMQLIETFVNEQNVKDNLVVSGKDPSISQITGLSFEDEDFFPSYESITPLAAGTLLNPEYERSSLAGGIIDKLLPNPNRVGDAIAGFGGASQSVLNPELKTYLDTVAWQAIQGLGFITEVTDGDRKFYEMSDNAVDYYEATRGLINDINPMKMILPSLSPGVESINITANNALGFNKIGNVAVKAQRAKDDSVQMKVVDMMGKMNTRILPTTMAIFGHQVNSVLNYRYDGTRIILDKYKPLKDLRGTIKQGQGTFNLFYSEHPYATALGLSRKKWNDAFQNAKLIEGKNDADALDQADAVMRSQARIIAMNYEMAKRFQDKTFYLNAFYASANGRYMYRQTVLNPQNLKPVRAILANAQRNIIDLNKSDLASPELISWSYNIGRVILPPSELKVPGTKTDTVGFNQVVNPTQKILSEGIKNPIYLDWIKKGKLLDRMTKSDPKYPEMMGPPEKEMMEIMESLADPEEWGLVTQAYIDVYNYHNAKENKKKQNAANQIISTLGGTATTTQTIIPNTANNIRIQELEQLLTDAKEKGDTDAVAQIEADLFKELDQIKVPYTPSASTKFEATVLAKPDGKQSGPTLQALQNRDIGITKRTGLMYNSQDNVLPEGDIRSLFFEKFSVNTQSLFKTDDAKRNYWTNIIKMMNNNEDVSGLIKELSRTPLMEYTYGRWQFYNQKHIMKFLATPFGQQMISVAQSSGIPGYSPTQTDAAGHRNLVKDFNNLIGNALQQTMDIEHQGFLSNLGIAWAMMGGQNARFQGPLGDTVYLGSKMKTKTGKAVSIPFERGRLEQPVTVSTTTSSARPAGRNRAFDELTLKSVIADPLPYGKEVANQLPVLTVQSLDAAIMANAIFRVNKSRPNAPAWGMFIHDSIISDSLSTRGYMRSYNDSMREIAVPGSKNFWSIAKSTSESFNKGLRDWRKSVLNDAKNKNGIEVTGAKENKYRAIHDYIARIQSYENKGNKEKILLSKVISLGYEPLSTINVVGPNELIEIHKAVMAYMNLNNYWASWVQSQKAKEPEFIKALAEEGLNLL